jgi:hypothetical protein
MRPVGYKAPSARVLSVHTLSVERHSILLSLRVETAPPSGLMSITAGSGSRKSRRRRRSSSGHLVERCSCDDRSGSEHTKCAGRFRMFLPVTLLETFQVLLEILAEGGRKHKGLQCIHRGSYSFLWNLIEGVALRFGGFDFIFSGWNTSIFQLLSGWYNTHCDFRVVSRRMLSISAKCPASTIRSASSNTKNLNWLICFASGSS